LAQRRRNVVETTTPFRGDGLNLLGELAESHPDFRKQIIPPVVTLLKDAVQHTNDPNESRVLESISWVEHTGNTLLKCGDDAKQILSKEVTSCLRDLQFNKSENVRKTAETLRKKIEDAR